MATTNGFLALSSSAASTTYRLHPVVVQTLLNQYHRRVVDLPRVVCAVLGERTGNVVDIRACFPLQYSHTEDRIAIVSDPYIAALDMHKQVFPKDELLGCIYTGSELTFQSSLLMSWCRERLVVNPVLVTVDVNVVNLSLGVRAYVEQLVKVDDRDSLARFESVPLELFVSEEEKMGVDAQLVRTSALAPRFDTPSPLLTDSQNLEVALAQLLDAIDTCASYVERVMSNQIVGDPEIAHAINNALSAIPTIDQASFVSVFNAHVQDLLLVVYLAKIARTQIAIADKLEAVL